jgi:hypothetical protein
MGSVGEKILTCEPSLLMASPYVDGFILDASN